MDYYNIDSEIIETLNTLRPPVKRDQRIKRERRFTDDTFIEYLESDQRLKLVRNYSHEKQTEYCNLRELKSSLSLILRRTSQRQIIEQYSLYSHQKGTKHRTKETDQNKPTIKVTIIPKSEKKPLIKHLKKHKNINRIIHATCSNQENSIPSKNVFIVVAGRKEKIYQIKTSGSDSLTKKDDVNDYYKHIYRALKMERKKKKVGSRPVKLVDDGTDPNSPNSFCSCSYAGDNNQRDLSGANRVRIIGRLGLNDQERYVLKCAATINDQPVLNYSKVEISSPNVERNGRYNLDNSSSDSLTTFQGPAKADVRLIERSDKETMTVRQESPQTNCFKRIENIENVFRIINEERRRRVTENETNTKQDIKKPKFYCNKESQATQVDIDTNIKTSTNEQGTQCNCKQNKTSIESSSADTFENSTVESDSPLVIISVFPNQEAVKTVACTNDVRRVAINKTVKKIKPVSEDNDDTNRKIVKTQSPYRSISPTKKSKPVDEDYKQVVTEARTSRNRVRSRSPKAKVSPRTDKPTQKDKTKFTVQKNRNINARSQTTKARDQGINTDRTQTRNKSTDRFVKKTVKQKQKIGNVKNNANDTIEKEIKRPTKSNISKVSVNINNDNEYYDVVFEQRKFRTDLTVRQKVKDQCLKREGSCYKTDSLENFMLPDDNNTSSRDRRSISQLFNNTIAPLAAHTSRINVRDSIEIVHRREVKEHENNIKYTQTKGIQEVNSAGVNDPDFLAPIKHFTGDDCDIYDPVMRDKEIRELLGIQRVNNNQHKMKECLNDQGIINTPICERLKPNITMNKNCNTLVKRNITIHRTNSARSKDKTKIRNKQELDKSTKVNVIKRNTIYDNDKVEKSETKQEDLLRNVKKQTDRYNGVIIVNNITSPRNTKLRNSPVEKTPEKYKYRLHSCIIEAKKQKSIHLSRKQYNKLKCSIKKTQKLYKGKSTAASVNKKVKIERNVHWDKELQTDPVLQVKTIRSKIIEHDETIVLFYRDNDVSKNKVKNVTINNEIRQITSSVEIRPVSQSASVALLKQTACSNNNIGSLEPSGLERTKEIISIETLFRGHKKVHTPNLGNSGLSLLTEDIKTTCKSDSIIPTPRKPFLRRLMSCLVMRTKEEGNTAEPAAPVVSSSVNSYHFSTSLAAVEVSSSIYDTSVSFFSNHTIGPKIKMKKRSVRRGFFHSVREFLVSRKC